MKIPAKKSKRAANEFIIKDDVPIYDEHEVKDDDGNVLVTIDKDKLQRIADNGNRRVKETGDEIPITIGHTRDGAPEDEQPEVVGFARNLRVGKLLRTGRHAIHATFRIFKDKVEKCNRFPRRSVEVWFDKWEIDPIALLGATTPARDLGLTRFAKSNGLRSTRIVEDKMDPKEIAAEVAAMLKETKEWKYLEQMCQEQDGGEEEAPMDGELEGQPAVDEASPEENTEPQAPPEEEPMDGAGDDEGKEVGQEEMDGERPAKYDSTPAPGNTFAPKFGGGASKKLPGMKTGAASLKYQRDQLAATAAKYERGYNELKTQNTAMRIKFQRVVRERDLMQLEQEGIMLDREEELNDIESMDEAKYRKHLDKIRLRYSRQPLGGIGVRPDQVRTFHNRNSREDAMRIADYASRKGISYEDAVERMKGSVEEVY